MTLFTRCIAVLTALLGVALMVVSAYAAKTDIPPRALASELPVATGDAIPGETPTMEAAAGPAPAPIPTIVPRYAAPLGARSVGPPGVGRGDNLSIGPRVWPVRSIKPRPINLLNLTQDGLAIPPDQLAVMQQVGEQTGIAWQIFAAIAKVESNFGSNMATSSAGAIGYGQFLPAMWEVFGEGGDPYDFRDVIPAMGRYLLNAGAPADIPGSLYSYNHSWSYVDLVLTYAEAYGYQRPESSDQFLWTAVGPITTYFLPGDHLGIDIGQLANPGGPIRAAHDGVVLFVGGDPCCAYGYYVTLVGAAGIVTLYAHLESFAVTEGQTVRQGDLLGAAGCTGRCTGPHLHFEVIQDSVRQDPLLFLP